MDLSIIIPCFNEELRIDKSVDRLVTFFTLQDFTSELVLVNDGSTDETERKLQLIAEKLTTNAKVRAKVLSYSPNRGKGYALRRGFECCDRVLVLLTDADLSCDPSEYLKLQKHILDSDLVLGSRKHHDSKVTARQPWYRVLTGKTYSALSRLLLGVPVSDFTCGFKLMRREAFAPVFQRMYVDRWAYDSELIALAFQQGLRVKEVGVEWRNDARTKVKLTRDAFESFFDLLTIAWRVRSADD